MELIRREYTANGGWETFLAYEDPQQDILVGLLRLRKCAGRQSDRQPELKGRCSIVRELHVYGTAVAVSARDEKKFQHQARLSEPAPFPASAAAPSVSLHPEAREIALTPPYPSVNERLWSC